MALAASFGCVLILSFQFIIPIIPPARLMYRRDTLPDALSYGAAGKWREVTVLLAEMVLLYRRPALFRYVSLPALSPVYSCPDIHVLSSVFTSLLPLGFLCYLNDLSEDRRLQFKCAIC
ncbi:hypothetical protein C8Q80DRAFT_616183 [Daedaleopsis nitida]|nr:hypothetical protein C8Q80DRAFT_616183 [Daedaleopsis nitida]